MKKSKIVLLSLVLFLTAGGGVVAGSLWGSYSGYSKVRVTLNDRVLSYNDVPAFVIGGSTVMPLRETAESLNAIIKWDSSNQTANIYKPNVNMIVAKEVISKKNSVDSVSTPFYMATKGKSTFFTVFVQVDNLLTSVDGFKLTISDPYGNVVDSREETTAVNQNYFWYTCPFEVKFAESGNYSVRFSFYVGGQYITVAEKLIVSE